MAKRQFQAGADPEESASCNRLPGAFSILPDALLGGICAFLSRGAICRLRASSQALYLSPCCFPPALILSRVWNDAGEGNLDQRSERLVKVLPGLARRAAGALRSLSITDASLIEPFCSGLKGAGPLRFLTYLDLSLCVVLSGSTEHASESSQQLLGEVAAEGQLPLLQELVIQQPAAIEGVVSMSPFWRAVGGGACPRLESVTIQGCSAAQLAEIAAAMRARPPSCVALRALSIPLATPSPAAPQDAAGESLGVLLAATGSRLEQLSLERVYMGPPSFQTAIAGLVAARCAALRQLKIRFDSSAIPSDDLLLHALASGAAPNITDLDLYDCRSSSEAWTALGGAMGPDGTCLRRLQSLVLLRAFEGTAQLEIFGRALEAGHGCPELERLCIREVPSSDVHNGGGAALAHALRPPRGLPVLKQLVLNSLMIPDFEPLGAALQDRPHARCSIERFTLENCGLLDVQGLGAAMAEGGGLTGVRLLDIRVQTPNNEWAFEIIDALAAGAGKQLERLVWWSEDTSTQVMNGLLHVLAYGDACPRLQSLGPYVGSGDSGDVIGTLDVAPLGTILTGGAACSASLTSVDLCSFPLGGTELEVLAAYMRDRRAIQLKALSLCALWDDLSVAGLRHLVYALDSNAGDALTSLSIKLEGWGESEAMQVVDRVVRLIDHDALPALWGAVEIDRDDEMVGVEKLEAAMERRRSRLAS